jgi:hypothetical protein
MRACRPVALRFGSRLAAGTKLVEIGLSVDAALRINDPVFVKPCRNISEAFTRASPTAAQACDARAPALFSPVMMYGPSTRAPRTLSSLTCVPRRRLGFIRVRDQHALKAQRSQRPMAGHVEEGISHVIRLSLSGPPKTLGRKLSILTSCGHGGSLRRKALSVGI